MRNSHEILKRLSQLQQTTHWTILLFSWDDSHEMSSSTSLLSVFLKVLNLSKYTSDFHFINVQHVFVYNFSFLSLLTAVCPAIRGKRAKWVSACKSPGLACVFVQYVHSLSICAVYSGSSSPAFRITWQCRIQWTLSHSRCCHQNLFAVVKDP